MIKSFICGNCGKIILLKASGTRNRNHCPFCLYSMHVDAEYAGDRGSPCGGLMVPIGKTLKSGGEESLVHKCIKCGAIRKNRVAGDDSVAGVEKLTLL